MASFSPDEYRHEGNAISLLNYHFVFIPKRRRKVLVDGVAARLQEIICDVCKERHVGWAFPALLVVCQEIIDE